MAGGATLRGKSHNLPAVRGVVIAQAIVEAVGTSLPELDHAWNQAIATPGSWALDRAVSGLETSKPFLQPRSVRHRFALRRRDGPNLAAPGPDGEIVVRFLGSDFLHGTLDPNLALKGKPGEDHRRCRIARQVAPFARGVMGVEDQSAGVEALQQYGARRGMSVLVYGGKDHGIRFENRQVLGSLNPRLEHLERIRARSVDIERFECVVTSHVLEVSSHIEGAILRIYYPGRLPAA
jgi:hypothetical protein